MRSGLVKRTDEFVERLLEHGSAVFAFCTRSSETFRPPDQNSVIDLLLEARVREGETESEGFGEVDLSFVVREVVDDEVVEALGAEVEQVLSVFLLLVFSAEFDEYVRISPLGEGLEASE